MSGPALGRAVLVALGVVALLYVALCAIMFTMQRSLLYHPQPRSVTSPQSTLWLQSEDARLVVTTRELPGPKALIYFGGNGEDVSVNLESFARAFPDYALYLLHYRGFGGSTGTVSERANHGDAIALFRFVHDRHPNVAVIGRSLGSGVAVRLASEQPVSSLVLVTPYDSIEAIAASQYPYLPVWLLLQDRYDSGRYAPRIHIRTMIVAAEHDEVIPRSSTVKLLSRFPAGVASITTIAGTGHNDISGHDEYLQVLAQALP